MDFELDREYIAKNLCVQKNKKNNTCKGTCHLKKKLEADEEKQDSSTSNQKELKEFQICQNHFTVDFSLTAQELQKFEHSQNAETHSFSFSIFHPPQV